MTNRLAALKLIDTATKDMQVAHVLIDAYDFNDLASIKVRKAIEMSLLALVVFYGEKVKKSRDLEKTYLSIKEYIPLDKEDYNLLCEANLYAIEDDRFGNNDDVDEAHLEEIIILEEYLSQRAEKIIMGNLV